ncbi:MAG: glycosyltransferase family 2 protein [Acidobacteriota bacterium]
MIDILLSTYNGEEYLASQLDSILNQAYAEIRVIARDDGSNDRTVEILRDYAKRDERVAVFDDNRGNLGAFSSFMAIAEISDSPYFLFADQDDVWGRDKISRLLVQMTKIEIEMGPDIPIVVFSDLSITDRNLHVVASSLWHYQQFDPNISRNWRSLLAQNVVLGCAMMGNASALKAGLPYMLPDMPHDHWIAVNAAKCGRIDFIREATILYRQHGANYSGANRFRLGYALSRLPNFFNTIKTYHRAAKVFGEVTTIGLVMRKFLLNIRRFNRHEEF